MLRLGSPKRSTSASQRMDMNDDLGMQELVTELSAAMREYDRLVFDEEEPHEAAPPASPRQIAGLEHRLGIRLPESYRAFLEIHNGWSDFDGGSKLLAVEDQDSRWVKERIAYWNDLWPDDLDNPFQKGALPVLFGTDENNFLVLEYDTSAEGGRPEFVMYDFMHEEKRYERFDSYLRHRLKILHYLIQRETEGYPDDEADETDEE